MGPAGPPLLRAHVLQKGKMAMRYRIARVRATTTAAQPAAQPAIFPFCNTCARRRGGPAGPMMTPAVVA